MYSVYLDKTFRAVCTRVLVRTIGFNLAVIKVHFQLFKEQKNKLKKAKDLLCNVSSVSNYRNVGLGDMSLSGVNRFSIFTVHRTRS